MYWEQGRFKEAEELGVHTLETRRRVLGLEHPDTLTSVDNLALMYWEQGRFKEAGELGVQTLETRRRVLGLEHPSTLAGAFNLAINFWSQDKKSQAIQLMTEVVTMLQKIRPDDPDTLKSRGLLQRWQNRWNKCIESV